MNKNIAARHSFLSASIPFICSILELLRSRNESGIAALLNTLHDILANLVNSMRGFLQISPTNINENLTASIYMILLSIPFTCSVLELLRSRNGSGMTLKLNNLYDILANLVNSMRGFLQIFPTNINKNTNKHLLFQGMNTFHFDHLRGSEVKEQFRNGTIAKPLTRYFS